MERYFLCLQANRYFSLCMQHRYLFSLIHRRAQKADKSEMKSCYWIGYLTVYMLHWALLTGDSLSPSPFIPPCILSRCTLAWNQRDSEGLSHQCIHRDIMSSSEEGTPNNVSWISLEVLIYINIFRNSFCFGINRHWRKHAFFLCQSLLATNVRQGSKWDIF